jgi:serine/threonine-protein kinase
VPLQPGVVVGDRYRIGRLLGEGRTGTVYVAEHVLLQKKVALKVLHPDLTDTPEGVARFEREAMATARIEHPNVAGAIDFGKLEDGARYLALEYVEGASLRNMIASGRMELKRALHVSRQIASALAAAQALDIVHRDLKPENVMLVTRGDDPDFVKIIDFGMVRIAVDDGPYGGPQRLTKAGAVFGTPEYIPPEQGIGQKVDSRADLYALGVMMFEMIAGVRPYPERDDVGILGQQLTLPVPTFAERVPGLEVPPSITRLVSRLLAARPQERIQQAEDVVRAIEEFLVRGESATTAPAPLEPLPAFALNTQLQLPNAPAPAAPQPPEVGPTSERAGTAAAAAAAAARSAVASMAPAAAKVGQAAQSISRGATNIFWNMTELVSKRRNALPEPLRGWLLRVPAAAILVAGSVLLLLSLAQLGLWLHRATRDHTAVDAGGAPAAASSATDVHVAEPAAADSLAGQPPAPQSNPNDPDVVVRSAQAKLDEGRDAEAVSAIARLLGKHPDKRNDDTVASILFKTASSNVGNAANATFSLLQGTMAAQGAEIIYQLAIDRSIPGHVRSRAEKWLHSPQFDRAASDALRVAARLRLAPTCEAKHAMLPMAAKAGGAAALVYLHELEAETGCGLSGASDCYSCLRKDSQLKDAIAQIDTRQHR